jgi:predicted nucleotidyltransferase
MAEISGLANADHRRIFERMDLTEKQVRAIRDWADGARYVEEVRLFGSRVRSGGPSDRDVDLAITVGGPERTARGHYYALSKKWQDELTTLLGVKAHVNLYNEPQDETVKRACDESSVLLWRIVRA